MKQQLDWLEAISQRLIEGVFHRIFSDPTGRPDRPAGQTSGREQTREFTVPGTGLAAHRWRLRWESQQRELGEPVISLGRAPDNDIVLPHPSVACYHAQLRWRQGRYYLYPPASFNGPPGRNGLQPPALVVNRQPAGPQPLNPGDEIGLGQVTLTIFVEAAQA